jgi:hypothetical protein
MVIARIYYYLQRLNIRSGIIELIATKKCYRTSVRKNRGAGLDGDSIPGCSSSGPQAELN